MKEVLLNTLKFGLIFFVITFAIHFFFPQELDLFSCFIVAGAVALAEFVLGFVRFKKSSK